MQFSRKKSTSHRVTRPVAIFTVSIERRDDFVVTLLVVFRFRLISSALINVTYAILRMQKLHSSGGTFKLRHVGRTSVVSFNDTLLD